MRELAVALACKNVTPERIMDLRAANKVFESAIVSKDVVIYCRCRCPVP